jgi:hypothetical protein
MIDWDAVEDAVEDAKGIAFDTCHKIYVLMDTEQVEQMREYEYDLIITSEEQTPSQMLDTLREWFDKSCPLKFIEAVETNTEDPNAGFTTLIEQGAKDYEECEDCDDPTCRGVCFDYDEEDEDEEEGDEDEED